MIEQATRVFISYSWDSEKQKADVLALANDLRKNRGVDVDIDRYVRAEPPYTPAQGWDLWMQEKLEWAEFVLIVCTASYKRRFEGKEETSEGMGVSWEGTIIRQQLYSTQLKSTKFIPVVFSFSDLAYVPSVLRSKDIYTLESKESYKELYYRLRKQPILIKPEVREINLDSPSEPIFFSPPSQEKPQIVNTVTDRKVFFSFHYQRDIWRVNVVRNHAKVRSVYQEAGYWDCSLWESTKRTGENSLKRLINSGLQNTSVTVVLIGTETSERKWVKYEIEESHKRGNGMLGIYIHNIKDRNGATDLKGRNPFDSFTIEQPSSYVYMSKPQIRMSQIYPTYEWVNDGGYNNFSKWVEDAARAAGR